jgi:hypothetical protein
LGQSALAIGIALLLSALAKDVLEHRMLIATLAAPGGWREAGDLPGETAWRSANLKKRQ